MVIFTDFQSSLQALLDALLNPKYYRYFSNFFSSSAIFLHTNFNVYLVTQAYLPTILNNLPKQQRWLGHHVQLFRPKISSHTQLTYLNLPRHSISHSSAAYYKSARPRLPPQPWFLNQFFTASLISAICRFRFEYTRSYELYETPSIILLHQFKNNAYFVAKSALENENFLWNNRLK